jgi:OmpA-OmpF porin, OOP family
MKIASTSLLLAALLGISGSVLAQAPAVSTTGYAVDQRGLVVKSGFGLCWRTGYWTPAMAIEECDPDLVPKKEEPKVEPVAAPAPAPAAAPAPAPKPAAEKVTLAADALFDFNKSTLRPEGKAKLDDVATKMGELKLEVIIAVGHADRIGSDDYNMKLSERRAAAVKEYLVSKGVEANRVYTEGKGKNQPVTKPDQCKGAKSKKVVDCLQPDRRVDVEIIGTKQPK